MTKRVKHGNVELFRRTKMTLPEGWTLDETSGLQTLLWCPGYGKCAIAAEGAGRPVKRGMCSWCKAHGGVSNRPPVRGYCRISRIIRIDSPAGQLQNP
jgi:hypothetical protein